MADETFRVPRSEQETIALYDVEKDSWHIYTNYPKHVRKYTAAVVENHEKTHPDLILDGDIDASKFSPSFMVKTKRVLSEAERKALGDRLRRSGGR